MALDKRRIGTFSELIYDKMLGKGWFRVQDILPEYYRHRGVTKKSWKAGYMSGDCSWSLNAKVRTGLLERKPNPEHKDWFLYKVIKQ